MTDLTQFLDDLEFCCCHQCRAVIRAKRAEMREEPRPPVLRKPCPICGYFDADTTHACVRVKRV